MGQHQLRRQLGEDAPEPVVAATDVDIDDTEEGVLHASLKDAEEEEGRKVQARACARTDSPGSRWR